MTNNLGITVTAETVVPERAIGTEGVGDRFRILEKVSQRDLDKLERAHPQAFAPATHDQIIVLRRESTARRSGICGLWHGVEHARTAHS